jgi:hypothetical protein
MLKKAILFLSILMGAVLFSCKDKTQAELGKTPEYRPRKTISYHFENAEQWLKLHGSDTQQLEIALAVNRTDKANFAQMDSVLIPKELRGEVADYLPFPLEVSSLKKVDKIIFFSYPTQTFAAYEEGKLVYTGQTNMGRKKDPTPTGLFYTNWKAEKTTSTFNDEWDLRWNFNIENKLGVGWHQYSLPGTPQSHSCLRLSEKDARYLYNWADEWILADEETVQIKGTPVIVFGSYDFDAPKPWLQLAEKPHALDISENEIKKQAEPYLNDILANQKNRKRFEISSGL